MQIELKAVYGDVEKTVCLRRGEMGPTGWSITIDNYHKGIIHKYSDGIWRFYGNGYFESEDIDLMVEAIEKADAGEI